jgi:hypothetical protein
MKTCKRKRHYGGADEPKKSTWTKLIKLMKMASDQGKLILKGTANCFETNPTKWWKKWLLIIPAYIIFVTLPMIILIVVFGFYIDLIIKLFRSRNADFYSDTIICNQITKIYAFGDSYVNDYTLTFFIILVLYTASVLVYFIVIRQGLDSDCHIRSTFDNNFGVSLVFFGIVLVIVIIDIVTFREFTNTVGRYIRSLQTKIEAIINKDYINQLSEKPESLVVANRLAFLQSYINEEAKNITQTNINEIKETESYKKIKTACLTYLVIKTIYENDYASKRGIAVDKPFFDDPYKLFLSISISTNKLIDANIKSSFKFDKKITSLWPLIQSQLINDCIDVRKSIDEDIMTIKNKTDSSISSKIIFFSLLLALCKMAYDYITPAEKKNETKN